MKILLKLIKYIDRFLHKNFDFLERNNYELISTDWPKTPIGVLPNQDKVGNSKFSLLFQNIKI